VYAAAGVATLAAALLPRLLGRAPVSMPMVFLVIGGLAFTVIPPLPDVDPHAHEGLVVHLTELCVIVSLMGAGLALNRRVTLRGWASTWRLLGITMPLTMVAVALLGWGLLGLGVAAAVLLAASLAPTDPVLATEVQVGEPADDPEAEEDEDEVRFALTSEAGLNDGLAFPFTYLAIGIAAPGAWLGHWLAVDVVWRLGVGVVVGLLTGWGLRKLFFAARSTTFRLAEHAEGFVALAATFLAYGFAELVEGYGFVAVFVCACTIRAAERSHGYHQVLHQYVEQVERMLTVLVIFLLGGAVATGLLVGVRWQEIVLALAVLLVIRPLAGLVGLTGGSTGPRDRVAISAFGVRGVGSLFYVAYGLSSVDLADGEALWRVVGLVVVGSIMIHGIAATPVMRMLDKIRARAANPSDGKADTPV
jgi:NhaP-type Na+/H+ or K+/H+ antiporter